jgi:glyoxylase-like metal-dependent hydrolase (beta-lactamase superfamily II)
MARMPTPEIAQGVLLVDTHYVRPQLAAAYVVRGSATAAVVETGSATAVPRILSALAEHGIARELVAWVVVTHVHLDHAGGAGSLLRELPNAKLAVHPRGARHMIDPSKLVAGTEAVYGRERTRALYGDVVPAAPDRVVEAGEGFTIDLGDRRLRVMDAPGHAKHHFVVHDDRTNGFFTGDAFGLSYRELDGADGPFLFPTTTPVQFDPEALHATLDRLIAARPDRVYLTHFGAVEGNLERHARALHHDIDEHVRVARAAPTGSERHGAIVAGLTEVLDAALAARGASIPKDRAREVFRVDLELNAQGLESWLDAHPKA